MTTQNFKFVIAGFAALVTIFFLFVIPDLIGNPGLRSSKQLDSRLRGNDKLGSIKIGGVKVNVEIADDASKQRQGLSGRESLCADCGMLFVFPRERELTFWMKDMNFPLDIIFLRDGKIMRIAENVPPPSETHLIPATVSSVEQADTVLEVNAGFSRKSGFKTGDVFELE